VCTNIYSLIQLDLVPVWWTGKHVKEFETVWKMLFYLNYDKTGLTSFCFSGPYLSLKKQRSYLGGSRSVAPLIRDLDTGWRWVVSFTLQPLYFQAKHPNFSLNRVLAGPQGRLGRCGEEKNLGALENRTPNCQITGKFRLCTSQRTWLNAISGSLQFGYKYNWHGRGGKYMQFFQRCLLEDKCQSGGQNSKG
jgi:hypothetical protein